MRIKTDTKITAKIDLDEDKETMIASGESDLTDGLADEDGLTKKAEKQNKTKSEAQQVSVEDPKLQEIYNPRIDSKSKKILKDEYQKIRVEFGPTKLSYYCEKGFYNIFFEITSDDKQWNFHKKIFDAIKSFEFKFDEREDDENEGDENNKIRKLILLASKEIDKFQSLEKNEASKITPEYAAIGVGYLFYRSDLLILKARSYFGKNKNSKIEETFLLAIENLNCAKSLILKYNLPIYWKTLLDVEITEIYLQIGQHEKALETFSPYNTPCSILSIPYSDNIIEHMQEKLSERTELYSKVASTLGKSLLKKVYFLYNFENSNWENRKHFVAKSSVERDKVITYLKNKIALLNANGIIAGYKKEDEFYRLIVPDKQPFLKIAKHSPVGFWSKRINWEQEWIKYEEDQATKYEDNITESFSTFENANEELADLKEIGHVYSYLKSDAGLFKLVIPLKQPKMHLHEEESIINIISSDRATAIASLD